MAAAEVEAEGRSLAASVMEVIGACCYMAPANAIASIRRMLANKCTGREAASALVGYALALRDRRVGPVARIDVPEGLPGASSSWGAMGRGPAALCAWQMRKSSTRVPGAGASRPAPTDPQLASCASFWLSQYYTYACMPTHTQTHTKHTIQRHKRPRCHARCRAHCRAGDELATVIGDVHGDGKALALALMRHVQRRRAADARGKAPPRLIMTGDLVDRGEQGLV